MTNSRFQKLIPRIGILEEDEVVLRRAGAHLTALDGILDRSDREPTSVEAMNEAIERAASSEFTKDTEDNTGLE